MRRAVLLTSILCLVLSVRAVYGAYAVRPPAVRSHWHSAQKNPAWNKLPPGIRTFLRQETSVALFHVLYQYGHSPAAPDGAVGPNVGSRRSSWFLEYQRAGGLNIIAGAMRHDRSLIDSGLRIFEFGLNREAADGSFPGSAWTFHGTAMFLAEAAPSLIVLRYSAESGQYAREVALQASLMRRAAYRMVRSVGGAPNIDDRTKNHRWYEAALGLQAIGALTGDARLQRWAAVYARRGIAMQRPNGVMPEDGGHDSGYQALGLTYALRYLALSSGESIRHPLYSALQRAEAWEVTRVNRDGSINQMGDTRTTACQERDPAGRCKTTFYAPIFNALTRWAVVTHSLEFEHTALDVWLVNWGLQPGDVLPPAGVLAEPNPARAGGWLTISGARFRPFEIVRLYVDGRLMQQIPCDQTGSFGGHSAEPNAHFVLPSAISGIHIISARGSRGTVRSTRVTVTG